MKKSVQVFLACTLFSFCVSAQNSTPQSSAIEKKLWENTYWHAILHYKKRTFGGYESQAVVKTFFLDPNGKNDPKAELLKNIEVLFDTKTTFENPNDHPACKFPLRYEWLRQQLNIDAKPFNELNCPDFKTWNSTLGAVGISMIFASSYTNNPASMFGHTFLRLQRVQHGMELPDLLHYTVNFAADTGTEKGMLYTIKGLFGFYPGYFSTYPYYVKIQQYNNVESRDLWEYKLNMSDVQLQRMIFHLWEMGQTYFAYYFVDENCSYFLLALLEATGEDIQLRKDLPFFTIPIDTLKIVKKETPWMGEPYFRASLRKRYEAVYSKFDSSEKKIFDDIIRKKSTDTLKTTSPESQAKILDASVDFLLMKEKLNAKTDFQKKLLDVRSQIPVPYSAPQIEKPADPLTSHPTVRMGAGVSRLSGYNFANLDFRGAYHDLIDDPEGFDPGAQIQSMEGRVRFALNNGDVALDHLKMIEVISLNPIVKYLSKPSWNVGFGWRKNFSDECFDCGSFYLEGGPGFTLGRVDQRRLYFTVFADGFFQAGPWNRTDYQIGPSGTSMIVMDVTKRLRLMITGNARYSPLGEPNFIYKGLGEGVLEFSKSVSLRGWANLYSASHEYGGSLQYYF
jgi:hypothetical protein